MRRRPERLLLLRSGRHLAVALDVLRRAHPGCHVRVIATPGTETALAAEGIGPADSFIYDAAPTFDAWPLVASGLYFRVLARGYDRVAVLWQDPEGSDRANVDRTAMLLSPTGFEAITPDGRLFSRSASAIVGRQARIAARSVATLAVLGALLYMPAMTARLLCRMARAITNPQSAIRNPQW